MRKTGFFVEICSVFAVGCSFGWLLEVIFRRFFSGNNKERRWINPGYLSGPWLPVYGFGLCALYILSGVGAYIPFGGVAGILVLIVIMTLSVTAVELIAGLFSVNFLHATLWDYSGEWGNFRGLICPRFAFFWGLICAGYLLFVHRYLILGIGWLRSHALFSVFVGIYMGMLIADASGFDFGANHAEKRFSFGETAE